ncbi:SDR family NAD(P)-dependent oxidoreductase, partial [Acinetobacter baumannii]
GITGLPYRTAYSAAKHALEGFFGALRVELWKTNITVLMVRSGAVKTRIAYNALIGNGDLNNHNDPIIENGKSPEAVANA